MEGIEKITAKIAQDAQAEISQLMAETDQKVQAVRANAAAQARQEADFDLGMKYFFEAAGARHVFPMHMWGDYSVVPLFKSTPPYREYAQAVMDVSAPGQEFEVD